MTAVQKCAACDTQTTGYTCRVCEDEWKDGIGSKPDVLCACCTSPCIGCKDPVCDFHVRASGECIACSGPTDAELHAAHQVPSMAEVMQRDRGVR